VALCTPLSSIMRNKMGDGIDEAAWKFCNNRIKICYLHSPAPLHTPSTFKTTTVSYTRHRFRPHFHLTWLCTTRLCFPFFPFISPKSQILFIYLSTSCRSFIYILKNPLGAFVIFPTLFFFKMTAKVFFFFVSYVAVYKITKM